ncbi:NAD(P)-dependent oxidoreductase [Billgrantia lactosivorans]|uniref:NAD(P)-dependent oxidoreductase n=1 Tax=Billgrantia lactosivorans TaxID=2185141 RepID=UPI000DAD4DFA|nr:NAD(P)-dependent oxidoreductase [Halomonas lactosivorans]
MLRILLPHPEWELRQLYGDTPFELLSKIGKLKLNEGERHWERKRLYEEIEDCDIVHSFGVTVADEDFFAHASHLRAFVRWAVDYRNVDVSAATKAGVLVTNGPPVFTAGVSELIIGLMLDLSRQITAGAKLYHAGETPTPGLYPELRGATIGLIGFGEIARYLTDLAMVFGMTILAADPYVTIRDERVEQVTFSQLLSRSDFVICLAKATEETEEMINAEVFAAMKQGAYFINPARGNLIDDAALLAALDNGHLGGAGVDVGRSYRQMPTAVVARHPKVIATPHIGGLTPGSVEVQCAASAKQIAAICDGKRPERCVNPEAASWLA